MRLQASEFRVQFSDFWVGVQDVGGCRVWSPYTLGVSGVLGLVFQDWDDFERIINLNRFPPLPVNDSIL